MTSSELMQLLRRAGFRGKGLKTAYAVMMAESGGNIRAFNGNRDSGDESYGLFQINMIDELGPDRRKRFKLASNDDLYDPAVNARIAFRMSRGGRDWSPWSAFKNGSYQQYMGGGAGAVVAGQPAGQAGNAAGPSQAPASPYGDYLKALGIDQATAIRPAKKAVSLNPEFNDYYKALGIETGTPRTPQGRTQVRASTPAAPPAGGLAPPGGGWGGSFDIATSMADVARKGGLSVMSEKRETKNTASGGVSDHWVGSKDAYAYDLSNGSNPTPEMDAVARQLAQLLGVRYDGKSELVLTKTINGYRYQILYRTNVGGNHFNHIHVGVRRA